MKIITAKELFDKMIEKNDECTSTEMMIEFAKIHVQAALENAAENLSETIGPVEIKRRGMDSIVLESYPLINIK